MKSKHRRRASLADRINRYASRRAIVFGIIFGLVGSIVIWQTMAAPNPSLRGDLNNDNKVNVQDLSILLSNYGKPSPDADINGDGKVDVTDLSILLSNYGKTYAPAPPTLSLTASPASINPGTTSKLTWSSTHATSCNASGAWNGGKAVSGTENTPNLSASATYAMTCTGPAGSKSASVTVEVVTSPAPTSEIATEAQCPNQSDAGAAIDVKLTAMICMTNNARRFHNLQPVTKEEGLMKASASKADDISKCEFSHTACGRPFDHWIKQYGYGGKCYAENIAKGQQSVRQAYVDWMNSPTHRANILEPKYNETGVAVLAATGGPIWVQLFGNCR